MNFVKSILKWWAIFTIIMFAMAGAYYFVVDHPTTALFLKDLTILLALNLAAGVWVAILIYVNK